MSKAMEVSKLDTLIDEFESGKLSRRELLSGILGAVALGAVVENVAFAQAQGDPGRKVLLERIMNQTFTFEPDGVTVKLSDVTVFPTDIAHQDWLFGTGKLSLRQFSNSNKQPIEATIGSHQGAPISIQGAEKDVMEAVGDTDGEINVYQNGASGSSNYAYDDLYGLVKSKLRWTSSHTSNATAAHVINFLAQDAVWPGGSSPVKTLFDDAETAPWAGLTSFLLGRVSLVDFDETEISDQYNGGEGSANILTSHGLY